MCKNTLLYIRCHLTSQYTIAMAMDTIAALSMYSVVTSLSYPIEYYHILCNMTLLYTNTCVFMCVYVYVRGCVYSIVPIT